MSFKRLNEKGSILILTMAFAFAFSMLGFGSIYLAGEQNRTAQQGIYSNEAFWLAEAGIDRAKSRLPILINPPPDNLGVGSYTVGTRFATCGTNPQNQQPILCSNKWTINSTGSVNNQSRKITQVVATYNIDTALRTSLENTGYDGCTTDASINVQINGADIPPGCTTLVRENLPSQISDIYPGLTLAQIIHQAQSYDPAGSGGPRKGGGGGGQQSCGDAGTTSSINGITCIKSTSSVTIPNNASGFLIIDLSGGSHGANAAQIAFNGNEVFNGILWIIGDAKFTGTPTINGSIFVNGDISVHAGGNVTFNYDENIIDTVSRTVLSATNGGGGGGSNLIVDSWKEVDPNT